MRMDVKIVRISLSIQKIAQKFVDLLENLKSAFDKRRHYDTLTVVICPPTGVNHGSVRSGTKNY